MKVRNPTAHAVTVGLVAVVAVVAGAMIHVAIVPARTGTVTLTSSAIPRIPELSGSEAVSLKPGQGRREDPQRDTKPDGRRYRQTDSLGYPILRGGRSAQAIASSDTMAPVYARIEARQKRHDELQARVRELREQSSLQPQADREPGPAPQESRVGYGLRGQRRLRMPGLNPLTVSGHALLRWGQERTDVSSGGGMTFVYGPGGWERTIINMPTSSTASSPLYVQRAVRRDRHKP